MKIDYHIHTSASHDARGSVEEYCAAATRLGLTHLGFANHADIDPALPHSNSYDHEKFCAEAAAAKKKFPQLDLRIGVEVTYQPEYEKEIAAFLDSIETDFVMGSVHIIGATEFCVSEEEGARRYFSDKCSPAEAVTPYFDLVIEAVKFGYFDVIGHFDAIKKYKMTIYEDGEFYGPVRKALEGIIKRDMAIEVNSSGFHHAAQQAYPSPYILQLYKDLGGTRLTLGSDSHSPEGLARDFDRASDSIRAAGFSELTVFEKRTPRQIAI